MWAGRQQFWYANGFLQPLKINGYHAAWFALSFCGVAAFICTHRRETSLRWGDSACESCRLLRGDERWSSATRYTRPQYVAQEGNQFIGWALTAERFRLVGEAVLWKWVAQKFGDSLCIVLEVVSFGEEVATLSRIGLPDSLSSLAYWLWEEQALLLDGSLKCFICIYWHCKYFMRQLQSELSLSLSAVVWMWCRVQCTVVTNTHTFGASCRKPSFSFKETFRPLYAGFFLYEHLLVNGMLQEHDVVNNIAFQQSNSVSISSATL